MLGGGVRPRGDGLRPKRFGATGVGPVGSRLHRDDTEEVVLDVDVVEDARLRTVERDTERPPVGGATADRQVFVRGTIDTGIDRVHPRMVGCGLPQHFTVAATRHDDTRTPSGRRGQVHSLTRRDIASRDACTGVGVRGQGLAVESREPDPESAVGDVTEFGAAVVVADDPFGGPAVVLGVPVRAPLPHPAAVTVTSTGDGERGVRGDGGCHAGVRAIDGGHSDDTRDEQCRDGTEREHPPDR